MTIQTIEIDGLVYVYDTETTGIPDFKAPSEAVHQPHLVDIAALLFDKEGNFVDCYEAMVAPNGWVIPDEVAAIHGITTEMALNNGVPEEEAIAGFLDIHNQAAQRVAHNRQFDDRIMRIAFMRYRDEAFADQFKAAPGFCTCQSTINIVKLPPTEKMKRAGFNKYKQPKVSEALEFFTGDQLDGAHRAYADAEAAARIYFVMHGVRMAQFPNDLDYYEAKKEQ